MLEGLRLYELRRGHRLRAVRLAQQRGREFLLRALDHFQAVDAPRDPRLAEAMAVVRGTRGGDGRWPLQHRYRGRTYFELERLGAPSRWNTLRALRVLKWWEGDRRRDRSGSR